MAEFEIEVRTFSVQYTCEKCGEGVMMPTGKMLMSDPPKFPHECTGCDHTMIFVDKKYPLLATRPIDSN